MARDKTTIKYGDLISDFIKTLGQANLVGPNWYSTTTLACGHGGRFVGRLGPPPASSYQSTSLTPSTRPDQPWKPGLRSAYAAICCHKFKPKNMTDDIFLARVLGHKLLGPNAAANNKAMEQTDLRTPALPHAWPLRIIRTDIASDHDDDLQMSGLA
jgi:hypothetical protein